MNPWPAARSSTAVRLVGHSFLFLASTPSTAFTHAFSRNSFLSVTHEDHVTGPRPAGSAVIVLSHWPHVATHVATQVAALVASVKGLGNKSSDLLPSPFTLATCAATSLRAAATSGEWN